MLNKELKEFFYYILYFMKRLDNLFYNFFSGGVGVGKLYFIKVFY